MSALTGPGEVRTVSCDFVSLDVGLASNEWIPRQRAVWVVAVDPDCIRVFASHAAPISLERETLALGRRTERKQR